MSELRYDWHRYGRPGLAWSTRIAAWFTTVMAVVFWPAFGWFAITRDWTVVFVPVLVTAGVVMQRLTMRKVYGVRR